MPAISMAKVPTVKFPNGAEMPIIGLGTYKSAPGEVTQAVKDAIDVGYRHIDGAHFYGNEKEVGEAIRAKIEEGVIKREDIFYTGKLWNTFHRPGAVEPSLRTTLEDLGFDYVDLYLMHWPVAYEEGSDLTPKDANGKIVFADYDYVDTWKALEEVCEKGLAKNIGVSNFNEEQLGRLLKTARIQPVTNQVECQPLLAQTKLSEFCKSRGIVITAYRPIGGLGKPGEPKLREDPKLASIAKKYNKTISQILLRYQVDRGHVAIPKSVNKSRIRENFEIFDFELSKEDIKLITSMDRHLRLCQIPELSIHELALSAIKRLHWIDSPYYPFEK